MAIDETKAEKVSKPFKKEEEKGWFDSAVDSVKSFFTSDEPSYEDQVSKGLKGLQTKVQGGEPIMPAPTPTATPVPTESPVSEDGRQRVLAKQYMLASLGFDWEPTEEDFIEASKPKLKPWGKDDSQESVKEEVAAIEEDDFIDVEEYNWEV